jgi:hypothetical protein
MASCTQLPFLPSAYLNAARMLDRASGGRLDQRLLPLSEALAQTETADKSMTTNANAAIAQ